MWISLSEKFFRALLSGAVGSILISSACLAAENPISLCELHAHPKKYLSHTILVRGHYETSYHISYLNSDKCPRYWYGLKLDHLDTGDLANNLREALETRTRMLGGDYYIEFEGQLLLPTAEDRQSYKGYSGFFTISRVTAFVKEAR